jgi:ABC-2 type transport system ATP-binding protein
VRDIIRAQRDRGATVFLNSHLLSEIEITCDRVCFIREGEVVASQDLHAATNGEVRVAACVRGLTPDAAAGIERWAKQIDRDGERLNFTLGSNDALPEVLRHLVASGAQVYEYTPKRASLEEMFVEIMGEDRGL